MRAISSSQSQLIPCEELEISNFSDATEVSSPPAKKQNLASPSKLKTPNDKKHNLQINPRQRWNSISTSTYVSGIKKPMSHEKSKISSPLKTPKKEEWPQEE